MAIYKLQSMLHFGKYQGQTIEQVIEHSPKYLIWCLRNLYVFCMDNAAAQALATRLPHQSSEIELICRRKSRVRSYPRSHRVEDMMSGWTDRLLEEATFYAMTDGQMGSFEDHEAEGRTFDWE